VAPGSGARLSVKPCSMPRAPLMDQPLSDPEVEKSTLFPLADSRIPCRERTEPVLP
jgi:hypothetical protein